jgi:hypothetical protein
MDFKCLFSFKNYILIWVAIGAPRSNPLIALDRKFQGLSPKAHMIYNFKSFDRV